jgi:hypothetical protein
MQAREREREREVGFIGKGEEREIRGDFEWEMEK